MRSISSISSSSIRNPHPQTRRRLTPLAPPLALRLLAVACALWLLVGDGGGAWAYNSGAVTCERQLAVTSATVGTSITVTCLVANGESESARGVYLSEHLPEGLSVSLVDVSIGGVPLEGVVLNVGAVGEVHEGLRTWRIVIETPEEVVGDGNPIPPGTTMGLRYALTAETVGDYVVRHANWVGRLEDSGTPVFGYREAEEARTVSFLAVPVPAPYLLLY